MKQGRAFIVWVSSCARLLVELFNVGIGQLDGACMTGFQPEFRHNPLTANSSPLAVRLFMTPLLSLPLASWG